MSAPLPGQLLPIETLYFRSDVACAGRLECGADDALFTDSGPVHNHVFVFPRKSIVIEHEGAAGRFVAGPNVIPLYNAGQHYRRRNVLRDGGVSSDWFAVAPDIVVEMAALHDHAVESRPETPFTIPYVPCPPHLWVRQRRIVDRAGRSSSSGSSELLGVREGTSSEEPRGTPRNSEERSSADRLQLEEEIVRLLEVVLALAAVRRPRRGRARSSREGVEHVKAILAQTIDDPLPLRTIAGQAGLSVFHLCKIFRQRTGFTIHEYRQQLRLRRALDEVLTSRDLTQTALELGFNSHSHFTFAFRRAFGITPSELRKTRVLPPLP